MELSKADLFWQKYIDFSGSDSEEKCSGDINFESKGFQNDGQISAILAGKKRAIFASLSSYLIDGEPLPVTGELYMVFNRNQEPCCIIEIESVDIIPFSQVTEQMAEEEGDDENLSVWKESHREIFEEEGNIVGFEFSPDLKLVYQRFKVVYK